jgi:protein-S-isoprenylcysteine O-methyltransferase Ste14
MIATLGVLGLSAGALLTVLLAINKRTSGLRMWPSAQGSWQSRLFWILFRTLNVSALTLAAIDWQPLGNSDVLRIAAAVAAAIGGIIYVTACVRLGKTNLYCGKQGLVTAGIYGWSRNPQYAVAMPTYVALAVAANSTLLPLLVGLLIAVFWLMAVNEEPWLEAEYGADFEHYKQAVPRFYNFGRLRSQVSGSAAG